MPNHNTRPAHNAAKTARRTVSFLTVAGLLLLASNGLTSLGPHLAHASLTGNIIINGGFEQGLADWGGKDGFDSFNFACEGVANANATVDATRWVEGGQSAKIFTGPVTPTGCLGGDFPGRTVGFTQFPQYLPAGLTFNNVTNTEGSFSFWFYLQPYRSSLAGFEVRVLGGETIAELDYVIDPDITPHITDYPNYTDPTVKFVDSNTDGIWNSGEPVVYDNDQSGTYTAGDIVIAGPAPPPDTFLQIDRQIRIINTGANYDWHPGDTVVYDLFDTYRYSPSDPVIAGTAPNSLTPLMVPGKDGLRSIIFNGYQTGQWYHFSRNLAADWSYSAPGLGPLNLSRPFSLVQFEGIAINKGGTVESETYWLDDVRVYTGGVQSPVETHYALFNFTDHNQNNVDSEIKWKLLNSSRQEVPYTLGQNTLPEGPYYLDAYYLAITPQNRILDEQIHLSTTLNIQLAMFPQTTVPGGYIILDNPVGSLIIAQEDSRRLTFSVQGTPGVTYGLVADTPVKPGVVEMNGSDLAENSGWKYSALPSLLTLTYQSSGSDSFSIIFGQPPVSSFTISVTSTTALTEASLDASSSSDPGGAITGYLWNFGDGQSGTGVTAHHRYTIGGSYTITLNVTESGGASRASSKTIHLTPNTLPSISFIDRPGYPLGSKITFKILDPAGNEVPYAYGKTLPYGVYTLEVFYQDYQVYNAPLSFTSQQPIQLQFSPLDASRTTFLAVNSTISGINITQNDNSQITFTLSGTGPYLIIVDVPSRPFFVEKNGSRIADWVYNSTSQTIAIHTDSQGSFLVSLVQPPSFPYLYLGFGVLGAIAAAVVKLVLVRRARKVRSS